MGEARGPIDTNPEVGVVSLPEGAETRLDHRNLVAPPPVGVVMGDDAEGAPANEGCSLTGISLGGAFTGEAKAFGRSSCGPPAGTGTLWTMGTGPLVSMAVSSRLDPEDEESLPVSSSESLLDEELEVELAC